ncbi:hypothetical protein ABS751_10570 [Bacillus subtilis]|uniref:hypothetical protein n=1 Tax=Bacillus subtilis TaxID=1423 RepID=UPI000EF1AEA5|nr:hypothetical protein [Bacillus subtilis]AYK68269.1 hypothetical protein D9C11_23415 [Bacillus subtilis subsp. subtilis]MDO3655336.1 hypothetical protein [Bacillus subtilis]
MYYVIFKRGQDVEKSKLVFEKPLTFSSANEMLTIECERYQQTGIEAKFAYKIMDAETEENVFNSKLQINKNTLSFFETIKNNSNVPENVVKYIEKIEQKEIVESDEHLTHINDSEARSNLESLKNKKVTLEKALEDQEKISREREIEFQRKMDKLAAEKASLEKIMESKEKEETEKESLRIEKLRRLEEEAKRATESMKEQRAIEKKSKEQYEKQLKEVEKSAHKAKNELEKVVAEYEKKQIERAKELKAIEEEAKEAERKAQLLKAEMEKQDLEHEVEKSDLENKLIHELPSENELPEDGHLLDDEPEGTENDEKNPKLNIVSNFAGTFKKTRKKQTIKDSSNKENDVNELVEKKLKFILDQVARDHNKEKKAAVRQAKIESKAMKHINKSRLHSHFYRKTRYRWIGILLAGAACIYIFDIDLLAVTNELKQYFEEFSSLVLKK